MYRLKQDFEVGWRSPVFDIDGMAGFRVFRRRFSPAASLIEKETDQAYSAEAATKAGSKSTLRNLSALADSAVCLF